MSDRADLVALLLAVADNLDTAGYPGVGVIRQAARALATAPADHPDDGCAGCGAPLEHPATGRRRIWCSERCRKRAANERMSA